MSLTVPSETITYAPQTVVGRALLAAMWPWVKTNAHAWYLDAIGAMFEQVASLVYDQDPDQDTGGADPANDPDWLPGYGAIFNPLTCPAGDLPYLAQYIGTLIPSGASEDVARATVLEHANTARGTEDSIVKAAKAWLMGTQSCTPIWRTFTDGSPNAYWFIIHVRPSEVVDVTQLKAAVNAKKPGGVMWTLVQSESYTWLDAIHTWAGESSTLTWDGTSTFQP